jgi:hypothetical protein
MIEGNKWLPSFFPKTAFLTDAAAATVRLAVTAKAQQSQSHAGALLFKSHFHNFQPLQCLNLFLCVCLFSDVFWRLNNSGCGVGW